MYLRDSAQVSFMVQLTTKLICATRSEFEELYRASLNALTAI